MKIVPSKGKLQTDQQQYIKKAGKAAKGVKHYQCKTCQKTFTETWGTIFYRKRTPEREILETLAFLTEGSRISILARVKGHKADQSYLDCCRAVEDLPYLVLATLERETTWASTSTLASVRL